MLESTSSHLSCSFIIRDYLLYDKERVRALAQDFINIQERDQPSWDRRMDQTRHAADNDLPWKRKKAVTYQHFVISPNPADKIDLDTLQTLTMTWASEFFGDAEGHAGKLGTFEVAVVYHDDNTNRIPHAHVIVNNTNLETWWRLHINDEQNNELRDRLQELSAELGLSYFKNVQPAIKTARAGAYMTKTERQLIKQGRWSWKQELRDRVYTASQTSTTLKELGDRLETLGVQWSQKDGGYVFTLASNPTRWKSSGYRLGKAYTMEALRYEVEHAGERGAARLEELKQNIDAYIKRIKQVAVVDGRSSLTLKDIAFTLRIQNRYSIKSSADYKRVVAEIEKRHKSAQASSSPSQTRYQASLTDVQRAEVLASEIGLIKPAGDSAVAEKEKTKDKPAGKKIGQESTTASRTNKQKIQRKQTR